MNFSTFFTRADDSILQELLGTSALRLLRALDPNSFNLARQRELILGQTNPQKLLANRSARTMLLDLLRPAEAKQLCQVLGLPDADPYATLASARFDPDRTRGLLEFFELPILDAEISMEIEASREQVPVYPLFRHQADAARNCSQKLRTGRRRVLLHMPTGSGKTRTAMNIIAEQLRQFPDRAVVWLAHSEELCEQAAAEFEKAWRALGSHPVIVQRFWGNRDINLEALRGSFVVAGLPKMYALVRKNLQAIGEIGKKSSLVIIDEAHQAIAPTYRLILDALVEPYPETALLGLSATPGRTWNNLDADEELSNFFNKQKIVLTVAGYENPVTYLINEGYLAKADFRSVLHTTGFELTEHDRIKVEQHLEIPTELLQRLAEDEIRNLVILTELERLSKRHRRIIVFATTVEHSDLLAYILRSRGIWARSVTGTTPASERAGILEAFKDGATEAKIVCNFGVLTTGFDAPQTSAALIARPTTSLVLYSQMVGRAIRGPKAGGNESAEIVTVVDSALTGFGDVEEAFLNWEDVWRPI